jgi:subtilisin-like proprotein convertase family protein
LAIQDLDIYVDIEHTYLEDLTLYLESPEGIRYLFARQLGGDKNDYSETIFDEEAVVSIDQGTPPFTGRFSPEESIADLYGTSAFGIWSLIIEDNFPEDTGSLLDFTLAFCLEGTPLPNSDGDSIIDEEDNCPEITNEDQSDIDNNGIGDVCDIFSALNLNISKKDTSCANKSNGSISFSALADYLYKAEILGDNGYSKTLTFTIQGNGLSNLAEGVYSICVTSASFSDFEYCFETQINAPEPLEVISSINALNSELNLSLAGSERYFISLNGQDLEVVSQDKITLPLNQKLNRIEVKTSKSCQGIYQEWINTSEAASVFPNPIIENANLILPDNAKVDLLLLSGAGTPLWQSDAVQSAGEAIQIPMGALNPGLYLLQVIYPERIETLKLLKR